MPVPFSRTGMARPCRLPVSAVQGFAELPGRAVPMLGDGRPQPSRIPKAGGAWPNGRSACRVGSSRLTSPALQAESTTAWPWLLSLRADRWCEVGGTDEREWLAVDLANPPKPCENLNQQTGRRGMKAGLTWPNTVSVVVGMPGFEPGASCSQSRRANQAAPHPVNHPEAYTVLGTARGEVRVL